MAGLYRTPPQKRYEPKPIGGILTMRQAAYVAAGVALGLLFSSPLGSGMNLHTLLARGTVVLVFTGMAVLAAVGKVGDIPLDQYALLLWRRKSEVSRYPWSRGGSEDKSTAQDFLGITDIRDGIVFRKDGTACLFLEVGGLNYYLLSAAEQGMVEASLARLFKPINRPLKIYVQTRYLDAMEALAHYREALDSAPQGEGPLNAYAAHLMDHMVGALRQRGVQVRRYYMVFYSQGESAKEELLTRAIEMAEQLQRVRRMPSRILTTDQVAELIDVANNKERSKSFRAPEAATRGYFALTVGRHDDEVQGIT